MKEQWLYTAVWIGLLGWGLYELVLLYETTVIRNQRTCGGEFLEEAVNISRPFTA